MTLAFVLAIALVGCGTVAKAPVAKAPAAPTVTTTSLPPATVGTPYSFTLQASGGFDYNWHIASGSLPAWATLNPITGSISGTPNATGSSTFAVTVSDIAGLTSAAQTLTLLVNAPAPLAVSTTTLPNGIVGFPYSATLEATGGLAPYTWSVINGSLPSWASLASATGVISGIPTAVTTSTFTVQVTDSEVPPASATQALSITAAVSANNNELLGDYAFRLQGFDDVTGDQFAVVGGFYADGKGNITGVEDINGPGGYQPAVGFTGTYGIGTDRRGMAVFKNSAGQSTTFAIALGTINDVNEARQASLIEFDDNSGTAGRRATGFVYYQDHYSLNLSSISGPYVFQFAGQSQQPGTRLVLTGTFAADGNGNLTSGEVDANTGGVMANENFTATIANGTGPAGRMVVTPTGTLLPPFVLYMVSHTDYGFTGWCPVALAMSTGAELYSGLFAGEILPQSATTFSAASLNGTSVGYSVGTSSISAGLWTFDGSAAATFNFVWSNAQYLYPPPQKGNLTYSVSTQGRVTTQGTSLAPGVPGAPLICLIDKNKGFLMSTDSSATAGFLEPQTGGPFSNASVSGNYFIGTVPPALSDWSLANGIGTSSASGTLDLTLDSSDPIDLLTPAKSLSDNIKIESDGYGSDINPGWIPDLFFYMISPNKAISMQNRRGWPIIMIFQR